jgi:lactate permease
LYRVVDEAGAVAVIGQGITRLTSEPTMQLLLMAWAFSAFLQGVAGFGVPIAVVAPLLIGLGFTPVVAVAAVAIGHSWSVTFGDMASSFQALIAATGLPGEVLAPWSSFFLGVACIGCGSPRRGPSDTGSTADGVACAVAHGHGHGRRTSCTRHEWAVEPGQVRRRPGRAGRRGGGRPAATLSISGRASSPMRSDQDRPAMSLGLALAYLVWIAVVPPRAWPWLHELLNRVQVRSFARVRELRLDDARGYRTHISVFGHAGALLLCVSLAFTPSTGGRTTIRPASPAASSGRRRHAVPASIGIASMVGFCAGDGFVVEPENGDALPCASPLLRCYTTRDSGAAALRFSPTLGHNNDLADIPTPPGPPCSAQ